MTPQVGKTYKLSLFSTQNSMASVKVLVRDLHDDNTVTIEVLEARLTKMAGFISRVPLSGEGWHRVFEECV